MKPRTQVVGVKYLPSYPAPLILFKAQGHQADRVLALARKLGIPETQDLVTTQLLFQLPEGSWIPESHFAVLAQILASVYHYRKDTHHEPSSDPLRQA